MIRTLGSLRAHLQTAIELEHSTIPPYLCALYSIREGTNAGAAAVIRSVVMEEMLHMALASNVLNAIGGSPAIDHPRFVPNYPGYMPHSRDSFLIGLEKFSPSSLETFLKIEMPVKPEAPPQDDRYDTIGQFYAAIEEGLKRLCAGDAGFVKDHSRQVTAEAYYGGGGKLITVTNLDSALAALEQIVDQGEGIQHTILDGDALVHGTAGYAHYFRFKEIALGRYYARQDAVDDPPSGEPLAVDWDGVYDMQPNPRAGAYPPGSALRRKADAFNQTYSELLHKLHTAFNGEPAALMKAVALMYDLKYLAIELMRIPTGRDGQTAGPPFEYVPRSVRA
jgi:hypothetical protein